MSTCYLAVAQSCSVDRAVHYVLPVSRMTLSIHMMDIIQITLAIRV